MNPCVMLRTRSVAFTIADAIRTGSGDRPSRAGGRARAAAGMGLWASSIAALTAPPGLAQDVEPVEAEGDEIIEEVTVTGSRIRRSDFIANSPIVTVTEQTFEQTSTVGFETFLYQLP